MTIQRMQDQFTSTLKPVVEGAQEFFAGIDWLIMLGCVVAAAAAASVVLSVGWSWSRLKARMR